MVEVQHPIANRPLQLTESLVGASAEDLLRDREHVVEDLDAWLRPAEDIGGASDGASNRACHAAEVEPIVNSCDESGAEGGSRTHNLLFTKQLLCH